MISISSPKAIRPWRARWSASGPAAEPVAGSSATPPPGANIRVFQRSPGAGEAVDAEHLADVGEPREVGPQRGDLRPRSRARRRRAWSPLSYTSTGSSERSTPSAASSPASSAYGSTVGIGCSIRPKTIRAPSRSSRTGTTPRPVSSRISLELQRPGEDERRAERRVARRTAPRPPGVKIRIRACAVGLGAGRRRPSRRSSSRARAAGAAPRASSRASVKTASWLPGQRRVGEDVADDVAEGGHRAESTTRRRPLPLRIRRSGRDRRPSAAGTIEGEGSLAEPLRVEAPTAATWRTR